MIHIHIGAGNFSLGFVAWLTSKAGLTPILLVRSPKRDQGGNSTADLEARSKIRRYSTLKKNRRFTVQYLDLNSEVPGEVVAIQDILFYNRKRDLEALTKTIRNTSDDLLLTTSVKEKSAIASVSEIILLLRESLNPSRKIFIMACENGFTTDDVRINLLKVGKPKDGLFFVNVVVDRICSQIMVDTTRRGDEVVVEAECFASMVIEETDGCDELYQTLALQYVKRSQHVSVYRHVKLCVLNASHIFLAGDAQTFGMPVLPNYLTQEDIGSPTAPGVSERVRHVRGILMELREGLLAYCSDEYAGDAEKLNLLHSILSDDYLDEILKRFSRVDDEVERVLSRLKAPTTKDLHTMSDFLRSMLDKIRPPVIGYLDAKRVGPPLITKSFIRIADLIARRQFPARMTRH